MTVGIVAAAIVFWPAAPLFLLMHGKDITFPKGTDVPTFVNGDLRLEMARFEPNQTPGFQSAAASSNVAISSAPVGADIYVDQNFVGNTPSTVSVPAGKHAVSVRKAGFQDWTREMNFSGGAITLNAELLAGSTVSAPVVASGSQAVYMVQPEVSVADAARQNRAAKTPPQQ